MCSFIYPSPSASATPDGPWRPHDPLLQELLYDEELAIGDVVELLISTALLTDPEERQRRLFVDAVDWAARYGDLFLRPVVDVLSAVVWDLSRHGEIANEEVAALAHDLARDPAVTPEHMWSLMAAAREETDVPVVLADPAVWISAAATLVQTWLLALVQFGGLAERALVGYITEYPWATVTVRQVTRSPEGVAALRHRTLTAGPGANWQPRGHELNL